MSRQIVITARSAEGAAGGRPRSAEALGGYTPRKRTGSSVSVELPAPSGMTL
jgi:hypothetical protein